MKTTGECLKCGGSDLAIGKREGYAFIGFGWFRSVNTEVFVCRDCGFAEEYVPEKSLARLHKWR